MIEWICAGNTEHDILESIRSHFPQADAAQLLARAMTVIIDDAQADPRAVIAFTFASSRHLHRRMVEANDFGGALKALKFMQDTAVKLIPPSDNPGNTDVPEAPKR